MADGDVGRPPNVFLSAGHELGGGAAHDGFSENPYVAVVGAMAVQVLRARGTPAWLAPLTTLPSPRELRAKLAWIAERARPGDLAVDIHLDIGRPGCAAFALAEPAELAAAATIAQHVSRGSGVDYRGAKLETESAPGRLAFLHDLPCRSILVELCSINTADLDLVRAPGSARTFAQALANGCQEVLAH
jgi:hypothetical protein